MSPRVYDDTLRGDLDVCKLNAEEFDYLQGLSPPLASTGNR